MIRRALKTDEYKVSELIASFRVELKSYRGVKAKPNPEDAKDEFNEYLNLGYPIFVAEDPGGRLTGYIVCKVSGNVVWVESLFVTENSRRKGHATMLYKEAEKLSTELGNETLYNWVHPNNTGMIQFLSRMGYDVLNLIEIRKPKRDETLTTKVRVGDHEYNY